MTKEEIANLIDKVNMLQFFNQRAGRELWGDKPKDVQDKDIENADKVFEKVKEALSTLKEQ